METTNITRIPPADLPAAAFERLRWTARYCEIEAWDAEACGATLAAIRACPDWAAVARLGVDLEDWTGFDPHTGKRGPMIFHVACLDEWDEEDHLGSVELTIGDPVPDCDPDWAVSDKDDADGWPLRDYPVHGTDEVVHEEEDLPTGGEDGHAWRSPHSMVGGLEDNPGVHGKGGGVTIHEVCARCGMHRHTDTWDQSWTGTGEPVETVRHVDPASWPSRTSR